MTLVLLTVNARSVLSALTGRDWVTSTEVAEQTGLPPYKARDTLRDLSRRRMVTRGASGHWGQWQITASGVHHLRRALAPKQLELVR